MFGINPRNPKVYLRRLNLSLGVSEVAWHISFTMLTTHAMDNPVASSTTCTEIPMHDLQIYNSSGQLPCVTAALFR